MGTVVSSVQGSPSNVPTTGAAGIAAGVAGDAQLLSRFLAAHDEQAFAQIVERHGPMVLGVCRRILGNGFDADDAFQAVFMVLARRAGAIDPPEMLGNWLYGVAYRTASKARVANARRRAREREVSTMPAEPFDRRDTEGLDPASVREVQQVVDEEVAKLPKAYRLPIVACHLQGLSRAEAAKQLNLNEGTLSSRLARGREMLASGLARRGLAPAAIALVLAFSPKTASAAVPASLMASTVKSSLAFGGGVAGMTGVSAAAAAGAAGASPGAVALASSVLSAMWMAKVKTVVVAASLAVLLSVGTLVTIQHLKGDAGPAGTPDVPAMQQHAEGPGVAASRTPDHTGTPMNWPEPGAGATDARRPATGPSAGR